MFDKFLSSVAAARDKITAEVGKFRNREFMEAVVAGCALVAAADGDISSDEKRKMTGFIQNSPELKVFDTKEVIDAFNSIVSQFEFDTEIGRAEALRKVARIGKKPDAARLLVRVCAAIGSADGNFDDSERAVCRLICNELSLNPADFDL